MVAGFSGNGRDPRVTDELVNRRKRSGTRCPKRRTARIIIIYVTTQLERVRRFIDDGNRFRSFFSPEHTERFLVPDV